ncbi:hypothetical protein LguiA_012451 [Lonicera macranthoides]
MALNAGEPLVPTPLGKFLYTFYRKSLKAFPLGGGLVEERRHHSEEERRHHSEEERVSWESDEEAMRRPNPFAIVGCVVGYCGWRVLNWVWFRPTRMERLLGGQGINGNPHMETPNTCTSLLKRQDANPSTSLMISLPPKDSVLLDTSYQPVRCKDGQRSKYGQLETESHDNIKDFFIWRAVFALM